MAAASYYYTTDTQKEMFQLLPSRGPQLTGMHPEGSTPGLSQELRQGGEERALPQRGYDQVQPGLAQPSSKEQYLQQNSHAQYSGVYDGRQQQMGSSNYAQGGGVQQMNAAGEQAAVPDNRDTMTKCNDNPPDYMIKFFRLSALPFPKSSWEYHWAAFLYPALLLSTGVLKFGGERFNNPENAEKNRKLNENILKRLKQVGMLVVRRAPRMLMNMAR